MARRGVARRLFFHGLPAVADTDAYVYTWGNNAYSRGVVDWGWGSVHWSGVDWATTVNNGATDDATDSVGWQRDTSNPSDWGDSTSDNPGIGFGST